MSRWANVSDFFLSPAKVRRLYDIANILSSLQLIKKVRLPLRYGMKPAYQWVGTELDTAAKLYGKTNKTGERHRQKKMTYKPAL